ncbi:MAG: hypothetical protein ACNS60_13670 [Candidatus Cyclobacteriaceae bacterium M2_1C_046]
MSGLTKKQVDQIEQDLEAQGITFEPLKSELLDHLICDIEIQIESGKSFTEAWLSVKEEIPHNHFNHLQTETMEILNKKVNPFRVFAIISLSLLAFATLFKMLHLAGAIHMLIAFLITISLTLLIGSARSIKMYREFKGRGIILLTTFLIIIFIVALVFWILRLPGAYELLYFSVISLCILFPSLSVYFYSSKQKLKDYLLIKLIRDNQSVLETAALTLIGLGLIFNYSSILVGNENFGGVIYFIFAIVLTGMYAYSLTWKHYVEDEKVDKKYNVLLLIFSSLAFIMFMLPVIGQNMNFVVRQFFAYVPMIIFCVIVIFHYLKFSRSNNRSIVAAVSGLLIFYPLLRLSTKLELIRIPINQLTTDPYFTIGFLLLLVALLVIYRKEKLFKALIILTIASHMIPNL